MSAETEFDPRDYHLLLMIERMQRDGRSEAAIGKAVRIASGWRRPAKLAEAHDNQRDDRHSTAPGR